MALPDTCTHMSHKHVLNLMHAGSPAQSCDDIKIIQYIHNKIGEKRYSALCESSWFYRDSGVSFDNSFQKLNVVIFNNP